MVSDIETTISHDSDRHRFELSVGEDRVGLLDYEVAVDAGGEVWDLTHTVVRPDMRGRGLASDLVAAVLAAAARTGVRVRPVCPYVVAWLSRHPEHTSVVV